MKKILLLLSVATIFLIGCSNTLIAQFAIVKKVNEDSIVIEDSGGETHEIMSSPTNDYTFEVNREYFFN